MRTKLFAFLSVFMVLSMVLAACAPQTVVVTQVVPGATQVVTQIVAGTPQVQVVTATPAPTQPAQAATFKSKDPTTWVTLEFGGPQTLDPASDYETSGGEIVQNTYDFMFMDQKNLTTKLVPDIATEIPTVANGGISADALTYTFKIRTGVKFHNGDPLTPHDVAYSFQRFILQGGSASPSWIFVQPILGAQYTDITNLIDPSGKLTDDVAALQKVDPAKLKSTCTTITDAIKADDSAGTVTMKLAQPWAPLLVSMVYFGAITDQKWVAANGGWDGSCDTWQKFYFPGYDAINKLNIGTQENGSGPFKIDHVTSGQEIDLVANPDYWPTTPLWDGGPSGAPKLQKVIIKYIADMATRLATYQAGDADNIAPSSRTDWPQLDTLAGATCDGSKGDCQQQPTNTPDMSGLRLTNVSQSLHTEVWYTWDVNTAGGNNYVGSGKLDGNGIPPNFFDDINVRLAFNQCFDFNTLIQQVYQGKATQVTTLMLPGEPGYDANAPHYTYDKDKCTAAFKASTLKAADGKSLWDTGFRFTMAYNTGNALRQTIALIFQQDLAQVNPNFRVDIEAIPWSAFLSAAAAHKLPIFIVGWQEDYPDPNDWLVPFASTGGNYTTWQNLPKDISSKFDSLIQAGVKEPDPTKRAAIYAQFNQLYYQQATELPLVLATNQWYFQRWDNNVYINPLWGWLWYYPFSKN